MDITNINFLGVIVATIAAFVFGGVYYGALSKPWMKAAGLTAETAKMGPSLFITTFVFQFVMAIILAALTLEIAFEMSVSGALRAAFLIWIGFVLTTLAINHRYQNKGWDLTIIDGLHWLGSMLVMGLVLGFMG